MTLGIETAAVDSSCPACGTVVAAGLLACPGCHQLVHADQLKSLASRADTAIREANLQEALAAWRASLDLLPPDSRQYAWVADRVSSLSAQVDAAAAHQPMPRTGAWKWLAPLGPAALILWKFKFVVIAALGKGKLLLLGLTKMSTLASMFMAVGVYWTVWGLWFALGLVISIYIHEMGHVAALRRYGIAATAPMFIPGFGALIRLKQAPASAREDARVGLAGPLWGLGAAIVALVAAYAAGGGLWAAIARTTAWLNLFNLMPIWQLDGSRGFAALTRRHRWIAVASLALAWFVTGDGLILLVLLVAVVRAAASDAPARPDRGALALYVMIALALAGIFAAASSFPGPLT